MAIIGVIAGHVSRESFLHAFLDVCAHRNNLVPLEKAHRTKGYITASLK